VVCLITQVRGKQNGTTPVPNQPDAQPFQSGQTNAVKNKNQNNNTAANLQSNRPSYAAFLASKGIQQPRQQRPQQMRRPQPMQRPQPVLSPVERGEMERKAWLAKLPPGISHQSYSWLFEEPENPGMRVKPVEAPVVKSAPVAPKRAEKRRHPLSREDIAEAFALEKAEMTDAYLASIARQHRLQAELSKKKAELVALGLVKKGEVVPDAFKRNGVFLSFEVEHQLRKAQSILHDAGNNVFLTNKAASDPTNPWAKWLETLFTAVFREVVEEIRSKPAVRPDGGRWHLADVWDRLSAADRARMLGAKTSIEIEEAHILDTHILSSRSVVRKEPGVFTRPQASNDRVVEQAEKAHQSDYERFRAGWVAPRISGSRSSSKPVHKGQAKVVTKRDVGVVVDPNMVGKVAFDKAANRPYVSAKSARVMDYAAERLARKGSPCAADGPVARPEPVVDLLAPAGKNRRVW
jgi:hypothetical protein